MSLSGDEFYSKLVIHDSFDCITTENENNSIDEDLDRILSRKILKELDAENIDNIQNCNGKKVTKKLDNLIKKMYEERQETEMSLEHSNLTTHELITHNQSEIHKKVSVNNENCEENGNDEMKKKIVKNKHFFKNLSLKFYKHSIQDVPTKQPSNININIEQISPSPKKTKKKTKKVASAKSEKCLMNKNLTNSKLCNTNLRLINTKRVIHNNKTVTPENIKHVILTSIRNAIGKKSNRNSNNHYSNQVNTSGNQL